MPPLTTLPQSLESIASTFSSLLVESKWQCSAGLFTLPAAVRVEHLDLRREFFSVWSQVLGEDHTVVTHDEGHDSAVPIVGGVRNESESADHLVMHNVVVR